MEEICNKAFSCDQVFQRLTALKMEAASTSETSAYFYQTTLCHNPEDSHLYTRRRENLKSCIYMCFTELYKLHVKERCVLGYLFFYKGRK
jgi:hypothetical protein